MRRTIAITLTTLLLLAASACTTRFKPLTHAHAHNDYLHAHPLADALAHGFCSIEADVHLVGDQLVVAHDREEAETLAGSASPTLEALYLHPLRVRAEQGGGRIYPDIPTIYLLIDIKTKPPAPCYAVLQKVLSRYGSILTTWDDTGRHTRAVTVILTGNHTHEMVATPPLAQTARYCASEGTLDDLRRTDLSPDLCPLISAEWKKYFTWGGRGPMPAVERSLLRDLADQVHREHRKLRLWGAPDNAAAWKQLRSAGVDLINTDDLPGLRKFLLAE